MAPKWVSRWYRGAAIYGLAVLLPQYLQAPPPGAEAVAYGFIGTAAIAPLVEYDQQRLLRATTMGGLLQQIIDLTLEVDEIWPADD